MKGQERGEVYVESLTVPANELPMREGQRSRMIPSLMPMVAESREVILHLQGDLTGCRTVNGGKLSSSPAEPGEAIYSVVA